MLISWMIFEGVIVFFVIIVLGFDCYVGVGCGGGGKVGV